MNKEKRILLQAVQEAGAAILNLQKTGFSIWKKGQHDILTEADLLANHILQTQLLHAFPDDGWLSEETADNPERLKRARVWVVDPIDGTREYAQGIPEYAISIALVEHGVPIAAAVFNPVTNELFHAIANQGAWLHDQRLSCLSEPAEKLVLLASRSEYKRGEWDQFQKDHHVQQVGSIAYKLALIAAGKAHATFSLGPKSEWDIAAGVLLVSEAGGMVSDKNQHAFLFNQKNVLVDGIVATARDVSDRIFAMLR